MDAREPSLSGDLLVPAPPPPEEVLRRPRLSRWVVVFAVVGLLAASVATAAQFVRLPYDSIGPGTAMSLSDSVTITGHAVYPPEGELFSTTVSVRERINPFEALVGWLDPDTDVVATQRVVGDLTPGEFRRLNQVAMADSKTTAQILALKHLGFESTVEGSEIIEVVPGFPASDLLRAGDLIVAVDDVVRPDPAAIVERIQATAPGDTLSLRIRRGTDPEIDVRAPLGSEEGRTMLGVRMTERYKLPFEIEIDSGSVVGPSAGLAYALELVDLLTPGELTGGARVAVTGDLNPDGTVGAIGGIIQKAATVRDAGVKIFVVPKANEVEAREHADGLDIRAVETFDDAIGVLAGLPGSDGSVQPGK